MTDKRSIKDLLDRVERGRRPDIDRLPEGVDALTGDDRTIVWDGEFDGNPPGPGGVVIFDEEVNDDTDAEHAGRMYWVDNLAHAWTEAVRNEDYADVMGPDYDPED